MFFKPVIDAARGGEVSLSSCASPKATFLFYLRGAVQQQLGTRLGAIAAKGVVLYVPFCTSFRTQGRGGNEKARMSSGFCC